MRALLAALLLLTLAFAGCADGGKGGGSDDDGTSTTSASSSRSGSLSATRSGTSTGSTTATGTGSAAANQPPVVGFEANRTSGSAPLAVNFTLTGTDADGDDLSWTLSFGDGSANQTGTALPVNVTHTFTAAGNYTARLDVTDGEATINRSVTVQATAAGAPAPTGTPITWSGVGQGTAVDICLTLGSDGEAYLYYDPTLAGVWHYSVTTTVPGAVVKTEWWAGDAFVGNQGASGVIPAGSDNVAVCGDVPTLTIDFELTLSPT